MIKSGYNSLTKYYALNESVNTRLFNTSKTGTSYYDDFLNPKDHDYKKLAKGLKGEIVYMTCDQYFGKLSKYIFHKSVEQCKKGLSTANIQKYAEMMKSGTKFNLPYLNYANESQEGRHRMLAADIVSPGDSFPVLVVTEYDAKKELGLVGDMKLWYGHTLQWTNKNGIKVEEHVGMDETAMKKKVAEIKKSGNYK